MGNRRKNQKNARSGSIGSVNITAEAGTKSFLEFDLGNGVATFTQNGTVRKEPLCYEVSYQGEQKQRYLVKIPYKDRIYLDFLKASEEFDVICSVDTSLSLNSQVTVGVITVITDIRIYGSKISVGVNQYCMIENHPSPPECYEQMNWLKAIDWIRSDGISRKILMVVDSDMDHIARYDDRSMPVFDERFLPNDVLLVYSSDKANDYWTNNILRHTDKICKGIRERFDTNGAFDFSIPSISGRVLPNMVEHSKIRHLT